MSDLHDAIRDYWDRDSATYDRSPGHAVTDPVEAAAWRAALRDALPAPPARVLDVGAGTGALALLVAAGLDVDHQRSRMGMVGQPPARYEHRAAQRQLMPGRRADRPHPEHLDRDADRPGRGGRGVLRDR
jgi:SAM-dependent methyltransferase